MKLLPTKESNMKKVVFLLILILSLSVVSLAYASYDDGKAAYDRGDYSKAYKEFEKLAVQGHVKAQGWLGAMYFKGKGVPQDYAEAVKWFRKAAEQGDADAQTYLADAYYLGKGVPQDHAEALKWLRKAADQGHSQAQTLLATAYYAGKDVPQNYAEALKWYRKAAEHGNAEAQTILQAWSTTEISLQKRGGVYELPVRINGVLTLNFILDTGASEVNIPADVALTLLRTGTIAQSDFLAGKFYELADGSTLTSSRFTIRELDIGCIKISQVPASIGPAKGSLLLGQSFLGRLESWSLDNKRHVLIIGGGQPR
jgi:clan AA aspartic protease (TIGR02281 family)